MSDDEVCSDIAKNLGVVPNSAVQEWSPLDSVTNPARIPPDDPFNNLQDIVGPSLTADLGFSTASNKDLDKSLFNDQEFPDGDLLDVFDDSPSDSATILNEDFIGDNNFGNDNSDSDLAGGDFDPSWFDFDPDELDSTGFDSTGFGSVGLGQGRSGGCGDSVSLLFFFPKPTVIRTCSIPFLPSFSILISFISSSLFSNYETGGKRRERISTLHNTITDLTYSFSVFFSKFYSYTKPNRPAPPANPAKNASPKAGPNRASDASRSTTAKAPYVCATSSDRTNTSAPCSRGGRIRSGIKTRLEIEIEIEIEIDVRAVHAVFGVVFLWKIFEEIIFEGRVLGGGAVGGVG